MNVGSSDYWDIRDCKLEDSKNRTPGMVKGLLVSKKAERVVYLDVEMDKSLIATKDRGFDVPASVVGTEVLNSDGDTHLIIPIGLVSLDEENETVCTEQLEYSSLTNAKRFPEGAAILPEYELYICRYYTGDESLNETTVADENFYNRPEFFHRQVHQ